VKVLTVESEGSHARLVSDLRGLADQVIPPSLNDWVEDGVLPFTTMWRENCLFADICFEIDGHYFLGHKVRANTSLLTCATVQPCRFALEVSLNVFGNRVAATVDEVQLLPVDVYFHCALFRRHQHRAVGWCTNLCDDAMRLSLCLRVT